ncbi:MAG TPA: helix-turn-helix transcriptional regulator [Terriglobia bacterium]|nr:helix-turn-helix transcriptional regulator [Terriglobia bacterium]
MPGRVNNGSALQVNHSRRNAELLRMGQTLKDLRAARHLTQQDLASQLGISASYLSLIESSKRRTTRKILRGLSDYLKVPSGYFVIQAMEVTGLQPRHQQVIQELQREVVGPALERAFGKGPKKQRLATEASDEARQATD